jgi:hypothetical protein
MALAAFEASAVADNPPPAPSSAPTAPPATNEALAERLFSEGRLLAARGDHAAACERFEASLRADPNAVGTLLNLALCRANLQKYATAVRLFRDALAQSRGVREDRAEIAQRYLREFEPKVSTIVVEIDPADPPELAVSVDGSPMPRDALAAGIPVDGGEHVVEATAPRMIPFRTTISVANEAGRSSLTIPKLAEDPNPPLLPGDDRSPRRTAAYVIGGIGIASLATALVVGLSNAIECGGLFESKCKAVVEKPSSQSSLDTRATVADITGAVGLAGLGVAAVLLLTAKTTPVASTAAVKLSGVAHPSNVRVIVDVAF